MDIKIQNATIVDGTGAKKYLGSIGVTDQRISDIGNVKGEANIELDASGLIAIPGCIDAHSHADQTLLWFPEAQNFIMQGVTTVIAGQCGSTPAPIDNAMPLPSMLRDYLFEISPHKYSPENRLFSRDVVNEWMERVYGWTITYETMSQWYKEVETRGTSINIATNIGHGTCRYQVLGEDYDRAATKKEVEEIKEHVIKGMQDGCIGVSVGLDYDPGYFADEKELLSIIECVKEYDGIYNPHFRKNIRAKGVQGKYFNRYFGYIEVLDHARKTGTPLHISHLCPTYGPNKEFTEAWDVNETPEILFEAAGKASMVPLVDALEEGMDLSFDTIMWPWPRKRVMPYLCSLFTPLLKELGSRERFGEWLKIPDFRKEITRSMWEPTGSNPPIFKSPRFPDIIYVTVCKNKEFEGKTIRELSLMLEKDPFETYLDLIADDPDIMGAVEFIFSAEREIREYFKHPLCSVSLDSSTFNKDYQLKNPPYSLAGQDMRSTFSGFPAFFETYVKNQKLFTIEEAVQKVVLPTKRWNVLKDRGKLVFGAYADIVLIDLARLHVQENDIDPRQFPEGIEYVIVNGEIVAAKGKHLGTRPGKVLKRIDLR